jgi:hypothetical protein
MLPDNRLYLYRPKYLSVYLFELDVSGPQSVLVKYILSVSNVIRGARINILSIVWWFADSGSLDYI